MVAYSPKSVEQNKHKKVLSTVGEYSYMYNSMVNSVASYVYSVILLSYPAKTCHNCVDVLVATKYTTVLTANYHIENFCNMFWLAAVFKEVFTNLSAGGIKSVHSLYRRI